MALNIKNADVEHLVEDITAVTGETKTEAIRRALEERKARLAFQMSGSDRGRRIRQFLTEAWRAVPRKQLGRRLSREEEDALLGYGREGV